MKKRIALYILGTGLALLLLGYETTLAQSPEWRQVRQGEAEAIAVLPDDDVVAIIGGTSYRSTDGGDSWSPGGTIGGDVTTLRADDDGNLYAGTWFGSGLFRSTDKGASWSGFPTLDVYTIWDVAVHPDGEIFLATEGDQVVRSTDGGASWSRLNVPTNGNYFWGITVDPNGNVLAGGQGDGIFRSTDKGNTWTAVYDQFAIINGISVGEDGRGYAATEGMDLLVSDDGGITWRQSGFVERFEGASVSVGRTIALGGAGEAYISVVYFGSEMGRSVYHTTDGGESWRDVGAGLGNRPVNALARDSQGRVFAAQGTGVFVLESVTGAPWNEDPSNARITVLTRAAGGATAVVVEPGGSEPGIRPATELSIRDLMGRSVATVPIASTSTEIIRLDVHELDLAPGLYFCRFGTGSAVPMIVIR